MKVYFKLLLLHLLLSGSSNSFSQKAPVKDILGTASPITFAGKVYNLSWSSHPSPGYYKEEFMPKGQGNTTFRNMILLDVLTSNSELDKLADDKLAELAELKKTNPYISVNEVVAPPGERMIDFTITANDADGKPSVAERNVYRYHPFTDKTGKKGVLLFAVATREYSSAIPAFLAKLKTTRDILVGQVRGYTIPAITKLQ